MSARTSTILTGVFSDFPQTFPANAAAEPQIMQPTARYQIFILAFALYLIIRRYTVHLF